jgi:hypothetical protein
MLGGPAATVMLRALVAEMELASLTCTVKLLDPIVVGVPEIAPEAELRDKPAGKVPEEIDHVYGPVPPVAAKEAL